VAAATEVGSVVVGWAAVTVEVVRAVVRAVGAMEAG
jgi:hypothetical protein